MAITIPDSTDDLSTLTSEVNSADAAGNTRGQVRRIECVAHPTQNTNVVGVEGVELVQFSVPFARRDCISASEIKAYAADGVTEIPVAAHIGLPWYNWDGSPSKFIRSAIVTVELNFSDTSTPVGFYLSWGGDKPTNVLPPQPNELNWVNYRDSGIQYGVSPLSPLPHDFNATSYGVPEEVIMEPRTWVTLPQDYLRFSEVFTPYSRFSDKLSADMQDAKNFLPRALDSIYNQDGTHVSERFTSPFMMHANEFANAEPLQAGNSKIAEGSGYATWIHDRGSFWGHNYVMTGELDDLIRAHRNMYFYNEKVQGGVFIPKQDAAGSADMKYLYGRNVLASALLMGNLSHLTKIREMKNSFDSFDHVYRTIDTNASNQFWTERHTAFKFAGYLAMWEESGAEEYKNMCEDIFDTLYQMQQSPDNGWAKDGSFRHTLGSHEGFGGYEGIGSPWMSALLLNPLITYYEHSRDQRVIQCIYDLYRYLLDYACYFGTSVQEYAPDDYMPHYLAGADGTHIEFSSHDSNSQHAFDVLHICVRGLWAAKQLGITVPEEDITKIKGLKLTAGNIFRNYVRVNQGTRDAGYTQYRVEPNRKATWMFGAQHLEVFSMMGAL